ncbi:hypothetical protein AMTRI_Chr01g131270 [Amborella trichopoda]|uniref:Uncharacterized protein n=1 Tax=Amborella trichopoda TaxID=13333 RepID=W1PBY7_AMBTC|nr:uncharacterized protein LOC18433294 [Amborella trichopoda]XP_011622969.1 uncharacterized protein LOC18433294 [Amborella trichopoda]ERN05126.1 hypothetical protein AMTR_s00053p00176810 [Amborella trichopoda]|eukprot:XP_006843451.1 uncharacterized protein LOC18433294 [Amborella trichopoda]
MADWRASQGIGTHEASKKSTRPTHRKPPPGFWKPTVPSWEKEFCTSVCCIPWPKLCETKKVMGMYANIVQWNDSAGEEAFHNAKQRFWAMINGIRCDIALPDPDIYIDKVDWNSKVVDPEDLFDPPDIDTTLEDNEQFGLGFENTRVINDEETDKQVHSNFGWGPEFCSNRIGNELNDLVPCSGWGDCDEPSETVKNDYSPSSGWEITEDNSWDRRGWETDFQVSHFPDKIKDGNTWQARNMNWRKREQLNRNGSRYKTTRYHQAVADEAHEDNGVNGDWLDWKGRNRVDFTHQWPGYPITKETFVPRQWNTIQSCAYR